MPAIALDFTCEVQEPIRSRIFYAFQVFAAIYGYRVVAEPTRELDAIRCHVCKVVFLEPPPDEMAVTVEFEERHITSADRLEKFFGSRRDPVLSFVANHISRIKKRGHILDVGCAGGHFLDRFFSESEWQKSGVEPSRFAAARAQEKGITTPSCVVE